MMAHHAVFCSQNILHLQDFVQWALEKRLHRIYGPSVVSKKPTTESLTLIIHWSDAEWFQSWIEEERSSGHHSEVKNVLC